MAAVLYYRFSKSCSNQFIRLLSHVLKNVVSLIETLMTIIKVNFYVMSCEGSGHIFKQGDIFVIQI
ncbi:unnamed protein product [Heterobilharzia americana]|nr:unnamed protein product [Heterobilharzia americana]